MSTTRVDYRRLQTDLAALGLLAVLVFLGLSLVSYQPGDPPAQTHYPIPEQVANWCGPAGAFIAHGLMTTFGYASFVLVVSMMVVDMKLFGDRPVRDLLLRSMGVLLMMLAVASYLTLTSPTIGNPSLFGSGGRLGLLGSEFLNHQFSLVGSMIFLGAMFLAGFMLAAEQWASTLLRYTLLLPLVSFHTQVREKGESTWFSLKKRAENNLQSEEEDVTVEETPIVEAPVDPQDDTDEDTIIAFTPIENELDEDDDLDDDEEIEEDLDEVGTFKVNPPISVKKKLDGESLAIFDEDEEDLDVIEKIPYELPDLDLLEEEEEFPYELLAKKAQLAAATLEKTFQEFGLNVKVSEIDTGPVVTQFELDLEPGLRVSKISNLADDLAIALRVPAVRIVSPIPGKNTVGVEVPNEKQVMVRMRELIEASKDETEKMRLPLFLGKDVSGRPMVVDLAKMPHLLIAGRTGTGKSVCLNTLILSLLMSRRPEQVKMLMIDPKMVELSPYMRIPHLMNPVITDMKKAEAILAWAVDKMEERYDMLARCGVRHLDGYNKLGKEGVLKKLGIDPESEEANNIPEEMPYIVIVADEMADMIMTSGKEVESHIIRLAQKSRAVGIHLVLATQKPTVDVITGLIKSNLPARISFQVASRSDSRVVLDEMGAERLLGCGDMLYLAPGTSNVTRAQGTYVSDEEVNSVIEFLGQHEPEYDREIAQATSQSSGGEKRGIEAIKDRDDVYEQAVEVVIREQRGSVSLLQRCLGIGYGRAARMVDYMAEDGIVGDYNGSQAREVLYDLETWEALKNGELEEQEV